MLKRLELVGFKSFADKTCFDFAPGITAIVGPNGSGKSNVVDAVRWILGEQSAKSLRGGEMADVIFNGSSSRKSLGMAEVSVTFDNSRRLLAVDADEVQLTRRVYRDGTGEYLINGQMARLKDFKEIFLGSGAGAGGYTIIAQGRVEELLQASPRDRREIFDEAAGISRFKAKKTETLRKLAAVEVNLTRSQDKLHALDAQLRTLRMQAAKAQKHKEYSERLRELRVGLSVQEYRELTTALTREQEAFAALQAEVAATSAETEQLERHAKELDWAVTRGEETLRHHESQLALARQHIATFETTFKHERAQAAAVEAELLKVGHQQTELGYRIQAIEAEARRAAAQAEAAEAAVVAEQQQADAASAALSAIITQLAELDREQTDGAAQQFELVRQAGSSRAEANATLAQVQRLQQEYTHKRQLREQRSANRAALAHALDGLSQADANVQARLAAAREQLQQLQTQRETLTEGLCTTQTRLEQLRLRQSDLRGRLDILENLERSLDGLGAGVAAVLRRHQNAATQADSAILGLVADLLTVPRELAPLVELALGETAQRFVVRGPELVDAVATSIGEIAGRVGFLPLLPSEHLPICPDSGQTLHLFVTCDHPDAAQLPRQLLGRVLLADTLADARQLAARYPQCRIVTRSGELLEPDGSLTVGPFKSETGLVSRKSELRELREQHRLTSEAVVHAELELAEFRRQVNSADGVIAAITAEITLLSDEAGDLLQRIARQRQAVESLDGEIELLDQEIRLLERQVQEGEAAWVTARLAAEEAEAAATMLNARLAELKQLLAECVAQREQRQAEHTAAQVALSRAIAERDRARERVTQIDAELRKRKIEGVNLSAVAAELRDRRDNHILAALRASAAQAEAYRDKENRERTIAEIAQQTTHHRQQREQLRDRLQQLRHGWHDKQAAAHSRELAVHDLTARREALAARIRDDYALELSELAATTATPVASDPLRHPLEEIDELKRKLTRLGSVNMEALDELTRVEGEFTALQAQHDDLHAARQSLQQVIDTINADSRKLFLDTLTAIRGYFQELFRKLFGGGQADILLEDENDVLECGIEITARPPGKELRSLSLLSGGEKTLTAVALLLAIFRNKPSPFCILDEVDAALDEANTQRLAGVLREFLDRSQFIVVTHKKRTMAAADRLWGVTMQESGISRLLPMRFEDWPDEESAPPAQAA
ncbi:MAG: chromosome segregation protein SMC [Gemmataceae bacterium]|nr:chromosome segregation protein SMC [Gemmata sp.]MDW8196300.1 chromosome segregation protein SMC [Gemmataceae bacterium]